MIHSGSPAPKLSEAAAGTLPLLACITLSAVLMVADHRGDLSPKLRGAISTAVEPIWRFAALPAALWRCADTALSRQPVLAEETVELRRELQLRDAQLARLEAVARENQRLRALLGGKADFRLAVQMAGIVDVDLDPWRQRVRLDRGSAEGDLLVTSGIGGRFPAGFAVGTVRAVGADDTRLFLVADVTPAAQLDRGLEVLLVMRGDIDVEIGPPIPPGYVDPAPAAEAGPGEAAAPPPTAAEPAE